jgi:hypothetical protein
LGALDRPSASSTELPPKRDGTPKGAERVAISSQGSKPARWDTAVGGSNVDRLGAHPSSFARNGITEVVYLTPMVGGKH